MLFKRYPKFHIGIEAGIIIKLKIKSKYKYETVLKYLFGSTSIY